MRRGNPFRRMRPLDALSVGEAFAKPGADTREWVSFGTVSTDDEPVVFSEEDGQPYVKVTLHPSLRPVLCRVGMEVAGDGEGEYTPFLSGDEVLVVMPGGREDGGATVINPCRCRSSPTSASASAGTSSGAHPFRPGRPV